MTDDSGYAELTERARQLGAEAEHLFSVTKRRREAVAAATEHALAVTGEAASSDGSVRVTVDAGGMLTELVFSSAALSVAPADLARLVTTVTQKAAARARSAARETFGPLRESGVVRGMPVLLPEPMAEPEPPAKPRRRASDEEEPFEERTIVRRRAGQ